MSFWEQVWATVLGAAIFGVLGWVVALAWGWLLRRLGKRPDWHLTLEPSGALTLERVRRGTAFEVRGFVLDDQGNTLARLDGTTVQDMTKGTPVSFAINGGKGRSFHLSWIDGQRLSAETVMPPQVGEPMPITAKRTKRRLRIVRS